MDRDELLRRYRDYLDVCNRHAVSELPAFLAPRLVVNGQQKTPLEYADDLAALFRVFPDYCWRLQRAIVEGHWIAVHLFATGTRHGVFMGAPADGSSVETEEFAMYYFNGDGRIEHVEVTADNARLIG